MIVPFTLSPFVRAISRTPLVDLELSSQWRILDGGTPFGKIRRRIMRKLANVQKCRERPGVLTATELPRNCALRVGLYRWIHRSRAVERIVRDNGERRYIRSSPFKTMQLGLSKRE